MSFSEIVQAQQFLPVKGIVNARDLGGYVTADGRRNCSPPVGLNAHLISLFKFKQGLDGDAEHAGHLEGKHG